MMMFVCARKHDYQYYRLLLYRYDNDEKNKQDLPLHIYSFFKRFCVARINEACQPAYIYL